MITKNMGFQARGANGVYVEVLRFLLDVPPEVSPRGMKVSEVINGAVHLSDARQCLVSYADRKLNYHFAVAEWWWIATGREDVRSIEPYCSEIAKFSDDGEVFFGAYGPRWYAQVDSVVDKLRADRDSRQAVITTWRANPPATKDVPCTVATQYFIRDGRLETTVFMRSWDAWLGMPYDLHNFGRLAALVAGELRVDLGGLTVTAGSLHLYERDRERARAFVGAHERTYEYVLALPSLPGLVPPEVADLSMDRIDVEALLVLSEPWLPYFEVMAHRHDKRVELSHPWKELIA